MKYLLNTHVKYFLLFGFVSILGLPQQVQALPTGPINLTTQPLATSTSDAVKPNLLFVLDNSGSMQWDHMPDAAADPGSAVNFTFGYYGGRSSQCNQVYYDPNTTYTAPVFADGTSYADAVFTSVLNDGYNSGSGTVNLNKQFKAVTTATSLYSDETRQPAYYYEYSGSETTQIQKNYHDTSNTFSAECANLNADGTATSDLYLYQYDPPGPGGTLPQAIGFGPASAVGGVFTRRRVASTMTAAIVLDDNTGSDRTFNAITVNGTPISSSVLVGGGEDSNGAADDVRAAINLNGYSATRSGNVIYILGPANAAGFKPNVSVSGGGTPYYIKVEPFPAAISTAAELTNFANWYSFYRTRMLMMKTATGLAFKDLNNKYRVGLMKISETGTPTVPLAPFEGTQRTTWYTALYTTSVSGSTPLRRALSEAGKYFAGKLGGTDPVTHSCQQNFSILSTDGYWNSGDGYDLDNAPVGNQDGTEERPWYDGATTATTITTNYTRTQFWESPTGGWGCSSGTSKIVTRPMTRTCRVTGGNETCNSWSWTAGYSGGACSSPGSHSVPSPNPSATLAGTPITTVGAIGGTSNNLADIAQYYYAGDLRPGSADNDDCVLCKDNVFTSGLDNNQQQHMTTFTLGLGASGIMNYSPSYVTDGTGDYFSVKQGLESDGPGGTVCTWQAAGTVCNWPEPGLTGSNGFIANIDDLWHAGVNGRGAYFSATNPKTLTTGLANALAAVNTRRGSAAAAATSTLNPVAGNNSAFVASYSTVSWKGNLESRGINVSTGVVSENATWCVENVAPESCNGSVVPDNTGSTTTFNCVTPDSVICNGGELDGTDCIVPVAVACTGTMTSRVGETTDTRKIWTKGTDETTLNNFNLASGALSLTDFDAGKLNGLTQWPTLSGAQQADAVNNIVRYLRGQKSKEMTSIVLDDQLFRAREAVLGDAVESQPAFVARSTFSYLDTGYDAFKTTNSGRSGTVYMGANDGMMHAFNADTGEERWAFVPSMVIPNLWKLADSNYAANHEYFVNGSPSIADVFYDGSWKTILVAGLNGGGRGYYALDITNPVSPKLLWEFTPAEDGDLGYTFGNPIVTKKANGDWVVLLTSGYNNIPEPSKTPLISSGDGGGYLYVLNPKTGAKISKIATGVGSTGVPSGLAKISAWAADAEKNNTATFVYGGDLYGNIWRFDINASTAVKFATLKDALNVTQPITTKPELGRVLTSDGKIRKVVFVGTGQYLSVDDLADTQGQTLYAIKDDDEPSVVTPTAALINPRASLVQQTIVSSATTRASGSPEAAVNFVSDRGWYVNFPDSGERQNVASQLVLGTLIVPTTIPSNTECSPGGTSWLNFFNYKTGGSVDGAGGQVSVKVSAPIVGLNVIYVVNPTTGKTEPVVTIVTGDNPTPTVVPDPPFSAAGSGFQVKRAIWRELVN